MFYEAFPKGGMQSISGGAKIHLKKVSQTASNSLKNILKQTNFPPQISPPKEKTHKKKIQFTNNSHVQLYPWRLPIQLLTHKLKQHSHQGHVTPCKATA